MIHEIVWHNLNKKTCTYKLSKNELTAEWGKNIIGLLRVLDWHIAGLSTL